MTEEEVREARETILIGFLYILPKEDRESYLQYYKENYGEISEENMEVIQGG